MALIACILFIIARLAKYSTWLHENVNFNAVIWKSENNNKSRRLYQSFMKLWLMVHVLILLIAERQNKHESRFQKLGGKSSAEARWIQILALRCYFYSLPLKGPLYISNKHRHCDKTISFSHWCKLSISCMFAIWYFVVTSWICLLKRIT